LKKGVKLMYEKKCPICSKVIRSNAEERYFCAVCGMGIPTISETKFIIVTSKGAKYFCCKRCLRIFKEKVIT
jgi:YHS domain-containing protein